MVQEHEQNGDSAEDIELEVATRRRGLRVSPRARRGRPVANFHVGLDAHQSLPLIDEVRSRKGRLPPCETRMSIALLPLSPAKGRFSRQDDPVADVAHGSVAAAAGADEVGGAEHFGTRVGHRAGQPTRPHDLGHGGEVADVVTHERHLGQRDTQPVTERLQRRQLVVDAKEDVGNPQLPGAGRGKERGLASDDRDMHPQPAHRLDPVAVVRVEPFERLAVGP